MNRFRTQHGIVVGMLAIGCTALSLSGGCGVSGGGTLSGIVVRVLNLSVDPLGDIRVDNNVIAVGTGENGGIEYLRPKVNMQVNNITSNESLQVRGFAVANGWIAARNFDGDVFLHNTATDSTVTVDTDDLALPSGNASTNEFWADGQYIVTYADDTAVMDGHKIKLINCGPNPPTISSFTQDIPDQSIGNAERVLLGIDVERNEVLALQQDVFYRYDMTNLTATPEVYDLSMLGGVTNSVQFQVDAGFVVYQTREQTLAGLRTTRYLNLTSRFSAPFNQNPCEPLDVLRVNNTFGYFVHSRSQDVNTNSTTRSVWGTQDSGGIAFTEVHESDQLIGNDRSDGLIGYGRTLAATKDGKFRFLAGGGNPAIAEVLQISRDGGEFVVVPTQSPFQAQSPDGLPATNVVTSNDICAFRVGGNDQVGYILNP